MRVTFHKLTEQRFSYWVAVRGKRTIVPGSHMALGRGGMPHDLVQFVVEAATGFETGFWGCVAAGATFKSTGRKRTKPGRAVIAKNREDLARAEHLTAAHVGRWLAGENGSVSEHLARIDRLWSQLPAEGELTLEWPSLALVESGAGSGAGWEPSAQRS